MHEEYFILHVRISAIFDKYSSNSLVIPIASIMKGLPIALPNSEQIERRWSSRRKNCSVFHPSMALPVPGMCSPLQFRKWNNAIPLSLLLGQRRARAIQSRQNHGRCYKQHEAEFAYPEASELSIMRSTCSGIKNGKRLSNNLSGTAIWVCTMSEKHIQYLQSTLAGCFM